MKPIYLDYAAATPLDPRVKKAMEPFLADNFYNPSALYYGARQSKDALETARQDVAKVLGSKPSEITFLSGGSESTNLAIKGVMEAFKGSEIIVSAIEHDAVLKPAEPFKAKKALVDVKGRVLIDKLSKQITDNTVMISVMYANNEIGTIQPIREISNIIQKVKRQRIKDGNKLPLYLHTDACQAPLYLDINVARLGVDLMTLNGGKMYGPKQSSILYHKTGVILKPQILGGGQEFGLRSGSENVAGCVGFAKALIYASEDRENRVNAISSLKKYFIEQLKSRFDAKINGHVNYGLPNNVHVEFSGSDNERVIFSLDDQGVFAASGSACSASSDLPSHVLLAIGLSEESARSCIRFTLGKSTTKSKIDEALKAIEKALKA